MNVFLDLLLSNVVLALGLAIFVAVVVRLWRSPPLAHILWLLVLIKLVSPPLVPLPWRSETQVAQTPNTKLLNTETPNTKLLNTETPNTELPRPLLEPLPPPQKPASTVQNPLIFYGSIGIAVWSIGALALCASAWRRHRRVRGILRRARPAAAWLLKEAEAVASTMGLKHFPTILTTTERVSPAVVWSSGRLTVLLPQELLDQLDRLQIRTVLGHEFAHIVRGDLWVRGFELFVLLLHWWNPIAWWASRCLRRAEEACCDARVIQAFPQERRSYGRALLQTVEYLTEGPFAAPVAAKTFGPFSFHRRVEMIVHGKTAPRVSWRSGLLAVLLGVAALPLAVYSQPPAPPSQPASPKKQPPKPEEPKPLPKPPKGKTPGKVLALSRCQVILVSKLRLSARTTGVIQAMEARAGSRVQKGQLLIQLDSLEAKLRLTQVISELQAIGTEADSKLQVAILDLKLASDEMERMKKLQQQAGVSRAEYATSENRFHKAKIRVEAAQQEQKVAESKREIALAAKKLAERQLEACAIRSPIEGMVLETHYQAGESVRAGEPLCTVISLRRLAAEGFVDASHVDLELLGRPAHIVSPDGAQKATGKVVFVSPLVDLNGAFKIRVEFENRNANGKRLFSPGVLANLKIELAE